GRACPRTGAGPRRARRHDGRQRLDHDQPITCAAAPFPFPAHGVTNGGAPSAPAASPRSMLLALRSLAANVAIYASTIVQMIFWAPFYFTVSRRRAWLVPKFWARSLLWLHGKLAGVKVEISGLENIPPGSFILAPKHQTFWDTLAFFPYLDD